MKYAILVLAAVVLSFSAQAQTNKQVAGSKSMEVQFAPLSGAPISINGIKFRSFSTESTAFRLTTNIRYNAETADPTIGADINNNDIELNSKTSEIGIQIRPGYEWHLPGTDKLSPYYGGELLIGYSSMTAKDEYYDIDVNEDFDVIKSAIEEEVAKETSLTLGLNAVAGFDYYFAQNIFFGTEIGFGLSTTSRGDQTIENQANLSEFDILDENEDPQNPNDETIVRGGGFDLGPNFVGQIRFGIIF